MLTKEVEKLPYSELVTDTQSIVLCWVSCHRKIGCIGQRARKDSIETRGTDSIQTGRESPNLQVWEGSEACIYCMELQLCYTYMLMSFLFP